MVRRNLQHHSDSGNKSPCGFRAKACAGAHRGQLPARARSIAPGDRPSGRRSTLRGRRVRRRRRRRVKTCNVQRATCNVQRATCNVQRASCRIPPVHHGPERTGEKNVKGGPAAQRPDVGHQMTGEFHTRCLPAGTGASVSGSGTSWAWPRCWSSRPCSSSRSSASGTAGACAPW